MAQDPRARESARKGADEVQRVDLDALSGSALCELPTGRAVEHKFEGLRVDTGPLSHDVSNEPAVMTGRELHRAIDCRVNVDPMRPDVPGESDVEQVFQGCPSDRWPEWERDVACGTWCAPPTLDRSGPDRSNVHDELIVRKSVCARESAARSYRRPSGASRSPC